MLNKVKVSFGFSLSIIGLCQATSDSHNLMAEDEDLARAVLMGMGRPAQVYPCSKTAASSARMGWDSGLVVSWVGITRYLQHLIFRKCGGLLFNLCKNQFLPGVDSRPHRPVMVDASMAEVSSKDC